MPALVPGITRCTAKKAAARLVGSQDCTNRTAAGRLGSVVSDTLLRSVKRCRRFGSCAILPSNMSQNNSAAARLQSIERGFFELTKRHFPDLWQMYISANAPAEKVIAEYLLGSSRLVISGPTGTSTVLYRLVENLLQDVESFWRARRETNCESQ